MSLSTLADACSSMSSNIAQKDLVGHKGQYPIYGASGLIGFVNFYKQEQQYIAVVKDGAGIGRVFSLPPYSSVIGTMQYLLPKDSIDVNYLYYAVQFMHLEKYYTGSTIPHIYFKDYKHEPLNIPSRDKQQEISSILILVDKAIDTLHAQIAHLEELVKSRFIELFGDPVTNPKGWKMGFLSECLQKIESGKSFICDSNERQGTSPGLLKLSAATYGVYNPQENKALHSDADFVKQAEIHAGDLLFTRKNTPDLVGMCAYVWQTPENLMMPDLIFRLIPNKNIHPIFLWKLINHDVFRPKIKKLATGSAQSMSNISQERLKSLVVFVPPLDLQNEFAAFVEQADKSKFAVLMHRQISLKTALLSAMFSSYTNSDRRICKSLHRRSVEHDEL